MRTSTFRIVRTFTTLAAGISLSAGLPQPAAAGPKNKEPEPTAVEKPSTKELENRVKELEDSVDRLNREGRTLQNAIDSQQPIAGWQNGFYLQSTDGAYKLKLTGYTQADGRFFIDDDAKDDTNRFLFRRVRVSLEGTLARYFDFRIMPDFANSSLALFDAYTDITYFPDFKLRIGKFKPPVGLERLQSATAITFAERGLPTNLVPSRDLGVQLWGEPFNGALTYAVGIFNGAQDAQNNDGELNDDKDVALRIFAHPLRNTSLEALQNLGVGVSGTFGHEKGSATSTDLPTYRSAGQATIFRYKAGSPSTAADSAVAKGDRYRLSPQVYYYFGPFGAQGEYVISSNEVQFGPEHDTLNHDAWQLGASYVITGEQNTFKGVTPAQPFNPLEGTWGAFEVGARYGHLRLDDDAFNEGYADIKRSVTEAGEWQVGVNWYLNKNFKVILDYANTTFDGGAADGDREREHVIFTRLQLVL